MDGSALIIIKTGDKYVVDPIWDDTLTRSQLTIFLHAVTHIDVIEIAFGYEALRNNTHHTEIHFTMAWHKGEDRQLIFKGSK